MLNAYTATYKNGQFFWRDVPPNLENQEFEVIFLQKEKTVETGRYDLSKDGEKRLGFMQDEKMTVPDDINKYDNEILEIFGID